MKKILYLTLGFVLIFACSKDDDDNDPSPEPPFISVVNVDLDQVPYPTLSEYNFFEGALQDMESREDVLPYDIISHLFTDYAKKERYVWMPDSVSANYVDDGKILNFPTGTVIIKTFYYDNVEPTNDRRIIETRLLIRKESEWIFADYVWNAEQNEAFFDEQGSFTPVQFTDDQGVYRDINYRIPSTTECETCHNIAFEPVPIGPKPHGLNMVYDYTSGAMNQLDKWEQLGMLSDNRPESTDIDAVVDWTNESLDLGLRVRSYLDINCSHCHSEGAYCAYRPMRFAFSETSDPENLGVCVTPDDQSLGIDQTHIVSAGSPENSMLYYRISSANEAEQMPLIGTSIPNDKAVQLIEDWINSLNPPCD